MRAIITLLTLATCSAGLLAACGGATEQGAATTPRTFYRFENDKHGFSIAYPAGYTPVTDTPGPQSGQPAFRAAFVDLTTGVTGPAATAVQVLVYRLNKPATAADVRRARTDVQGLMAVFTRGYRGVKVFLALKPSEFGGYPVWRTGFTFTATDGTDMVNMSYVTLKGRRAYWVSAQTSRQFWDARRDELAASLASFRLH